MRFLSSKDATWKMNIINQGGEFTALREYSSVLPWPIRGMDAAALQTQAISNVTRE